MSNPKPKKELQAFCYGIGQGVKAAESRNPNKIGQHIEAMRRAMIRILRERRKYDPEFVEELLDALAKQGIILDLDAEDGDSESDKP